MSFTDLPGTPPLDISNYHLEEEDVEVVHEDDEDNNLLENEFNPFDPVWGVMYRSSLNESVKVETKCLEKIGTRDALTFASDKLKSIGMSIFM